MPQTQQEMFRTVSFFLNEDPAFARICQQANKVYPVNELKADQSETSPIERYMVSKFTGGWFMPWWYKWYYSITQDEIDRYVFRTLMLFRDRRKVVLTSLRPGEQALIALFSGAVCAPIMNYLRAMNPIGILLRMTLRLYCQVSAETAGWFWNVRKKFDSLANWMIGKKPVDVTIKQTVTGYEIKQGNQVAISHTMLREAVKNQEETSSWQVFKKREYTFDTATLSQAWNCYWVEQERASVEKNVVVEKKMHNPNVELTQTETQEMMPDNQRSATSQMLSFAVDKTQQALSELEALVNEDDQVVFWEGLCVATASWEVRLGTKREAIRILSALRNEYPCDSALKESEDNFKAHCQKADASRKMTLEKIEEKQQGSPWSPEYIEALWYSTLQGLCEYQSDKPEGWLLCQGVKEIESEYERLWVAFDRIIVLLGKDSTSELLDEIPEKQGELYYHYTLLKYRLDLEVKKAEMDFHALGLDVVGQMRVMFDAMVHGREVDVSVFKRESSAIITSFVEKTLTINSGYIAELDKKRNDLEISLMSFQAKYIMQLEEHLDMLEAENVALVITQKKEENPRIEEASGVIPLEFRQYYTVAIQAYKILDIELGRPVAELKKAYFKKALTCHPDRVTGDSQQFLKLQWAYLYLTECDEKTLYVDNRNVPFSFYEKDLRESKEYFGKGIDYINEAITDIASKLTRLENELSDYKMRFDAWASETDARISATDEPINRTDEKLKDLKEGFKSNAEKLNDLKEGFKVNAEQQKNNEARIDAMFEKLAILEKKPQAEHRPPIESTAPQTANVSEESHDTTPSSPPLTFAYGASTVEVQVDDVLNESKVSASMEPSIKDGNNFSSMSQ